MNAIRRSTVDSVGIGGGWLEYLDEETNRPYYMNQVTEEVTWNHPFPQSEERRTSQQQPPPVPDEGILDGDGDGDVERDSAALADAGMSLPPGWSQWIDSNGAIYYTHGDGRSTWTRPTTSELQEQPQISTDSIQKDVVIQLQVVSVVSEQPSSSANSKLLARPASDSILALVQQKTPPPVPPRSRHPSDCVSQSALTAASPKESWSAYSAANMETLLQPFPSVLNRLRASSKAEHAAPSASQPFSFSWYTLGLTSKFPSTSQFQPLVLDSDVLEMGASIYYQSKGGLFKKSRTLEDCLSYEALPSLKPTLQVNRVAGDSVVGFCKRCCVLVMLYMGDYLLDSSEKDKDLFREKDNAINAASGSSRLVLIIREIFDIMRTSVQLADEAYARVLKQLCNNYRASSVEAGWSLLLLLCSHVGCSDVMMRFLMIILNKCIVVERDLISRSKPDPWYAAHVVIVSLSHRNTARVNHEALSPFVDAEVENSFRKLKHLSPLYSFIEEITQLERKFHPAVFESEILTFLPSTLVLLTDLIHARGGFRTDGIFRLAGERSCVTRVRASISCRFPIVEADSDPLVLAEVNSELLHEYLLKVVSSTSSCFSRLCIQVLKQWLRELPCPVIPPKLHDQCTIYAGKAPPEVKLVFFHCTHFIFTAVGDVHRFGRCCSGS
jgi:hypothetical protein